ncbi:MAG TPA: hypothetical protein VM287_01485 [Egibacteraceae bacterium]|nr:hypothetical protein [Egibacteraceae bacterium]
MRPRLIAVVVAAATCTAALAGVPAVQASTTPYCGITWGSLPKTVMQSTASAIADARVGKHECFERLVIDLHTQPAAGYHVTYIEGYYNQDTGERVPVAGGATIKIHALAPAHDLYGNPTVPWHWAQHIVKPEQFTAGGFRTFRDLVFGGTYEGETDFVLGVRARLPFRVFTLAGPGEGSRLVVDVAHQW